MRSRQEVARTQRHWRGMNRAFVSLVSPHNDYVEKRDYNPGKKPQFVFQMQIDFNTHLSILY